MDPDGHMRNRQEIENNSVEFLKCGSSCCIAGIRQLLYYFLKESVLRELDCIDCTFFGCIL